MKRKAAEPQAIAEILEKLLQRKGLAKKLTQYHAMEIWAEAVGPAIAKQASPLKMQGDILVIATKSAAWVQELTLMKYDILKKLRTHYPEAAIKDIRFTVERP